MGCCLQFWLAGDLGPAANACRPVIWKNYDRKKSEGFRGMLLSQSLPLPLVGCKRGIPPQKKAPVVAKPTGRLFVNQASC